MESKVISVFYGSDLLPYKDSARAVHYPITGSTFACSNNTTSIRFYVDQICGTSGVTWVVVSKLPNGTLGYEIVSTIGSDNELGENYLEFNLSSYYTQYKGVVKLALRCYSGNIAFESDDDGVYTISGNPLIEVTGTIDVAINYSPFVNTGAQLLPTEIDMILAALSNYAQIGNTIVVVPTLPLDLTNYEEGQIFYNKSDKNYYILSSNQLVRYNTNNARFFETSLSDTNTMNDLLSLTNNELAFVYIGSLLYLVSPFYNTHGNYYNFTMLKIYSPYDDLPYLDFYRVYNTIGTTTLATILDESNSYHHKITTKQYVDTELANKVDKTSSANKVYGTNYQGNQTTYTVDDFYDGNIARRDSDNSITVPLTPTQNGHATSKYYVDNIVATVKSNTFQVVSSLPQQGEEGIIYLIEVSSGVYNQYIWESGSYISLGTTQIDLSGYVQKTLTIAGIDLVDNITSQELTDALVFVTDSDIDNLF